MKIRIENGRDKGIEIKDNTMIENDENNTVILYVSLTNIDKLNEKLIKNGYKEITKDDLKDKIDKDFNILNNLNGYEYVNTEFKIKFKFYEDTLVNNYI